MPKQDYDDFSVEYDRFVNWDARLEDELPFILKQLNALKNNGDRPPGVLDTACGTGMHAITLAGYGFRVAGADISPGMVEIAKDNASQKGLEIPFHVAGFGDLKKTFAGTELLPFDALLCLGNSLPHLLSEQDLLAALKDFAGCLRPGGKLIIQNRNFNAVMDTEERWLGAQSHREGKKEWLFLRFYDFDPDGRITFNIVRLCREGNADWSQSVSTIRLFPLTYEMLNEILSQAGFDEINTYGKLAHIPYDPAASPNLVLTARRA